MLRIAIQMDPIDTVNVHADTTYALAREALARGHRVWTFHPDDLSLDGPHILSFAREIAALNSDPANKIAWKNAPETLDLRSVDVVLVRQDPPFDMGYLSTTWILERLMPDVLVLNNPTEIRNAPEKLFVTEYKDLTPPTLITRNKTALAAFRTQHKDVILKPLYGNGGAGIFRVKPDDENFNALLEMFLSSREPVIAQAYLSAVRQGDKRVILLDGKAVGAINRIPADGEARSNMHVGGRAEAIDLTKRDQEICDRIGPELSRRGLIFVGIDIIGGMLTEINVTSPTGIQEVKRFGGNDIAALHWDWVEAKRGV